MAEMTEEKLAEFLKPVAEILARYGKKERYLIPVLQEAQEEYGYLPEEVLKEIAIGLNLSLSQVYGVVTFYSQFHQEPRGNNIIRVCMGTACHVRGGEEILNAIKDELKIEAGQTTEDLEFTLESVACIGACGLAPVIMINDDTHGRLTPESIPEIISKYK
ncbi:NADH-quinone oxidoreductase subunit NuoE [Halanaerobium praevalens]|uniref:NADH-quinone oxidoreductase, E subunit n=1 Tax=Halanaerobium praevalens (strain ATCC 33744 / DSM 2228 / GSL) TaxID=572479 RepID=E3DPJ5_HALPG|nr:NADH-quinone oxidoreductase subunit NuoE [Halanaerobium praevalens]ADO77757.1 NADH-quinone oxidoreductase, E subunit [Halanaerobium praevalens DSM 2228]